MLSFVVSVLFISCFLFIPGCIFFHAGFKKLSPLSVCFAPALSCLLFLISGVTATAVGLSGTICFCLLTICFAFIFAFPVLLCKSKSSLSVNSLFDDDRLTWMKVGVCAAVGAGFVAALFLSNIDGLSSFIQYDDNLSHLAWIKSIADSGNYSTIQANHYDPAISPSAYLGSGSYYPIVWHIPAALLVSLTGIQTSVAENASIFCFTAFVYPLGMLALLSSICKNANLFSPIVVLSSFASVAFPMRMLAVHGPFPNIAAFCLVPAVIAMLVRSFSFENYICLSKAGLYAFCLCLFGVAGVHPNAAIFTCLLIGPFILLRIIPAAIKSRLHDSCSNMVVAKVRCAQFVFCVLCVLLWIFVYSLPFMKGTVSFTWEWGMSLREILKSIVSGSLFFGVPQRLLFPLVALGVLYVTFYEKEYRWTIVSCAIVSSIYIGSGAFSPEVRSLLSGFWYTDPERIAAMVAISFVPFAYFGLYCGVIAVNHFFKRLVHFSDSVGLHLAAGLIALTFSILVYYPFNYSFAWEDSSQGNMANAFTFNSYDLFNGYSRDRVQAYTAAERDFIQQVIDTVPEGSLIINLPVDGSSFAWSVDGLNLYYHATTGLDESKDSHAIRCGLCDISIDPVVRRAVKNIGAEYVLLLDRSDYTSEDEHRCYSRDLQYSKRYWKGITAIDDSTTGFEPVLASGSMRLYLIK